MSQAFFDQPRSHRPLAPGRAKGPEMLLSVVVPCKNEEEGLREAHRRLVAALESAGINRLPKRDARTPTAATCFEIIYVDDGSSDDTATVLRELQAADSCVRVVRLSRNFGHQIAITAGLEHASGDAVVIIDADLQDPPEVIGEFLARWREGFDVVYGVRTDRPGETAFKLWTAKSFYRTPAFRLTPATSA